MKMTSDQALKELCALIPSDSPLLNAIERFIEFYEKTTIEGCEKENDEDMLLFQWGGPYSWDESFSINLTRQFSFNDESGEYERMQQLSMGCMYDPSLITLKSGNLWFDGVDINDFRNIILSSECVKEALGHPVNSVELELDDV